MKTKTILKWGLGIPAAVLVLLLIIVSLAPDPYRNQATIEKEQADKEAVTADSVQQLIHRAKVYSWDQLPVDMQKQVPDYQSYFQGGWATPRNSTQFDKRDGYYVKAVLGNRQLAELSKSKVFKPEEVLTKKPLFLYGKYLNRWTFQNDRGEISETQKFSGFNTIEVKRVGNQDTVWIGPIPEKPSKMTILGRGDDSATKPSISL